MCTVSLKNTWNVKYNKRKRSYHNQKHICRVYMHGTTSPMSFERCLKHFMRITRMTDLLKSISVRANAQSPKHENNVSELVQMFRSLATTCLCLPRPCCSSYAKLCNPLPGRLWGVAADPQLLTPSPASRLAGSSSAQQPSFKLLN